MVTIVPELHQRLDDFGGLDRHLVRELGDRDRLGHRDFADHRLGRRARTSAARRRRDAAWRPPFGPRQPPTPPPASPRVLIARRRAGFFLRRRRGLAPSCACLSRLLARLGGRAVQRAFGRPWPRRPARLRGGRCRLGGLGRFGGLRLPPQPCAAASSASRSFFVLRLASGFLLLLQVLLLARHQLAAPCFSSASRAASSSARRCTGAGAAPAGASSTIGARRAAAGSPSSRLTSTRFLRTSTWIVRALPVESASLISVVCLRVSVIFFFASPRAVLLAQVVEQPRLVLLGERVALASCRRRRRRAAARAARRPASSARSRIVRWSSAPCVLSLPFVACLASPLRRRAALRPAVSNQCARAFMISFLRALGVHAGQLDQLVDREVGERVARRDAVAPRACSRCRCPCLRASAAPPRRSRPISSRTIASVSSALRARLRSSFTVSSSNDSISSISLIGT